MCVLIVLAATSSVVAFEVAAPMTAWMPPIRTRTAAAASPSTAVALERDLEATGQLID